jgi:hypothetical protein
MVNAGNRNRRHGPADRIDEERTPAANSRHLAIQDLDLIAKLIAALSPV